MGINVRRVLAVLAGICVIGLVLTTPAQGGWAWALTAGPALGIFGGAVAYFARGLRFSSTAVLKSAVVGGLLAPIVVWFEGAGTLDVFSVLGTGVASAAIFGAGASLILFGFREPASDGSGRIAIRSALSLFTVKTTIRAWNAGQLAWISLSIALVEWLLYQFILHGNAPLIARQLLGVLLLIVIPAAAIVIGWTWLIGRHHTRSDAQSDRGGRIRRMTAGQFWIVTAVFALACLPFIQRSRTGYARLVTQQDELTRSLIHSATYVGPNALTAQQLFQLAVADRHDLEKERAIGYACDAIVILIGALWASIAWVWFGRVNAGEASGRRNQPGYTTD